MKITGTILPTNATHESFRGDHGEIKTEDFGKFLDCAREALRVFGLSHIGTLNVDTEAEQEIWGEGEVMTEGTPPHVVAKTGEDVDLGVNWVELLDADTDSIVEALKEASTAERVSMDEPVDV